MSNSFFHCFVGSKLFSLGLSLRIIGATLPILLLLALIISYCALRQRGWIRLCIELCINLPIIFPPIGIGFLLVFLFGSEGLIGKSTGLDLMFTFPGLVLAATITGLPFIAQTVITGIDNRVKELCEASYTLGKSRIETFFRLVLPLLRTNIIAGTLLASARILGEVGITLMIGGNISGKTNTISLEIYNAVLNGENDEALKLSLFLMVFSTLIFIIIKCMDRREPA